MKPHEGIKIEIDNVIVDNAMRRLLKNGSSYYISLPKYWLRSCGLSLGGILLLKGDSKSKQLTLTVYEEPEPIEFKKPPPFKMLTIPDPPDDGIKEEIEDETLDD